MAHILPRLVLSMLACLMAAAYPMFAQAQQQPQGSPSSSYSRGGYGETPSTSAGATERADAVRILTEKLKAVRSSGADPATVELKVAQYEFYLAALEAIGREELIKVSLLRQGDRAQGELQQIGKEAKRLSGTIENAISRK